MKRIIRLICRMSHNTALVPFETMYAFFSCYTGIVSIFKFGVNANSFTAAVGEPIAQVFNVIYVIAGLSILFGIGLTKKHVEAFGLIVVVTSSVVRIVAITFILSSTISLALIFNSFVIIFFFITACLIRLRMLYKLKIIEGTLNQNG